MGLPCGGGRRSCCTRLQCKGNLCYPVFFSQLPGISGRLYATQTKPQDTGQQQLPATCACTRVACGQATAHMAAIRATLFRKRPPYGTCRRRCLTATRYSQHAIALASFIVMCEWRGSSSTARGDGKCEDAFATPGLLSRHQNGSIFAISGNKIEANFRLQN